MGPCCENEAEGKLWRRDNKLRLLIQSLSEV